MAPELLASTAAPSRIAGPTKPRRPNALLRNAFQRNAGHEMPCGARLFGYLPGRFLATQYSRRRTPPAIYLLKKKMKKNDSKPFCRAKCVASQRHSDGTNCSATTEFASSTQGGNGQRQQRFLTCASQTPKTPRPRTHCEAEACVAGRCAPQKMPLISGVALFWVPEHVGDAGLRLAICMGDSVQVLVWV